MCQLSGFKVIHVLAIERREGFSRLATTDPTDGLLAGKAGPAGRLRSG